MQFPPCAAMCSMDLPRTRALLMFLIFSVSLAEEIAQFETAAFKNLIKGMINTPKSDKGTVFGDPPDSFHIIVQQLTLQVAPDELAQPQLRGAIQSNFEWGKGLLLKPKSYHLVRVFLPRNYQSTTDVCGVILSGQTDYPRSQKQQPVIKKLQIFYNEDAHKGRDRNVYNNFYRGKSGKKKRKVIQNFYPRVKYADQISVLMFDPVPAKLITLKILPKKKKLALGLRVAIMYNCEYKNAIKITNCAETIESPRFAKLPFGQPIRIHCPDRKDPCRLGRPCWGYAVYTSDSPICYAARQFYGKARNGYYNIYKVKMAPEFRLEFGFRSHDVHCNKWVMPYQGYAFSDHFYNVAKKEMIRLYGA